MLWNGRSISVTALGSVRDLIEPDTPPQLALDLNGYQDSTANSGGMESLPGPGAQKLQTFLLSEAHQERVR